MPVQSLSIDMNLTGRFNKLENKSGLVNDLLYKYFQDEDAKARTPEIPKSLSELAAELVQAQRKTEALANEVIQIQKSEEQKADERLRLLRMAETNKLSQHEKDRQKALIHLDFIKAHEPEKFDEYVAIYKSKGLYNPVV